ncbi:polysaccharide export protein [Bowmanella sp. Y26]|uniref:polysaccharide biosynthesis/export family protein n=1 Tax=Bowmanella yangjiangensis TaxID=2811230 RepID=UPI001BDD8E1F|nr:polysaccharide biosynthesis/export family protein [Bowmanella yangjiangensis]MBT1065579.1 polysaccharide export protein [Bowmanella yangjiangensis]
MTAVCNRILSSIFWCLILFGVETAWGQDGQSEETGYYQLDSGDLIQITVFGQADLSLRRRLPETGIIHYPFLGDIQVAGLTARQLEAQIYQGLKDGYLVAPSVSVSIEDYRPFFIDGEVKRPGGYPFQPGLTVDKAAALAGGYTERASRSDIQILRNQQKQPQRFDASPTDKVLAGDIVTVKQRFF